MKQWQILQASTDSWLWDGIGERSPTKLVHTCDAIRTWLAVHGNVTPVMHNNAQDLLHEIMRRINGFLDWKFHALSQGLVTRTSSPQKIQQARRLWVQQLIEELKDRNE